MNKSRTNVTKLHVYLERTLERSWGAKSAPDQIYRTSLKRTSAPVALERNWGARATKHSSG